MTIDNHEFQTWKNNVRSILDDISIPWELHLKEDEVFKDANGNGRLYLQIQFNDIDNVDGESAYRSFCRKWYLSPYMTIQEIVRTAWLAYKQAVSHEADEKFKYQEQMIYNPHISPKALIGRSSIRDRRPPKALTPA